MKSLAPRTVIAALLALLIGPLAILPVQAFADEWRSPNLLPQRFGLRGIERVLGDGLLPEAAINSALVALACAVIGVLVAWPASRSLARLGSLSSMWFIILLPLLLPPLVVGEGLRVWFLRFELADSLAGLILAHLVFVIPYCILVLTPGFSPELQERESAALMLSGDRYERLRSITLPALKRQVGLAFAFGFTISWAQYGTSLGVGGGIPMLPLLFVPLVRSDPQVAAVLDLIVITPPLLTLALSQRSPVGRSTPDARASL